MSPENSEPSGPTFRDLYEQQSRTDTRLEKQGDRISRLEKAVYALILVVVSPKLGGPDAAKLIADVLGIATT